MSGVAGCGCEPTAQRVPARWAWRVSERAAPEVRADWAWLREQALDRWLVLVVLRCQTRSLGVEVGSDTVMMVNVGILVVVCR